LEIYKLYK